MPIFSILLSTFIGVMSGYSPYQISQLIQDKLGLLVLVSWIIWPISHFINFKFILNSTRLTYVNFVQVLFNTVISFIVHKQ